MELSDKQLSDLTDMVLEKALLRLPEIVGTLMQNHATNFKLVKEFYDKHPELKKHRAVVAAAIEHTEMNNPGKRYEEILEFALPEIERRLSVQKKLSFDKPEGKLNLEFNTTSNGAL